MATLSAVFSRISGGATSVKVSDAQKAVGTAGGFGRLSLTGAMVKKGIAKLDGDGDGRITQDEFVAAVQTAARKKPLPTWDSMTPSAALAPAELGELVKATAKARGGALGGMVDSDGVAKLAVAMLDDDGDGKVAREEAEALRAELE